MTTYSILKFLIFKVDSQSILQVKVPEFFNCLKIDCMSFSIVQFFKTYKYITVSDFMYLLFNLVITVYLITSVNEPSGAFQRII